MQKYSDLVEQIDSLTKEAERVRKAEIQAVIGEIKRLVKMYGLTASQVGLETNIQRKPVQSASKKTARATSKSKPSKGRKPVAIKYRDSSGNTWTGRGKQPKWLTAALSSGHSLEMFRVQG